MKDDLKYIDKFYKNSLGGYEEEAETAVWGKLRWTLFWMRYKWYIGLSSMVILLGLGYFVSYNFIEDSPLSNEIVINTNTEHEFALVANQIIEPTDNQEVKNVDGITETPINNQVENEINLVSEEINTNHTENNSLIGFPNTSENQEPIVVNEQIYLSGISSLDFDMNLSTSPDSNLMGHNRRTDILPPDVRKQWLSVNLYAGPSYSESTLTGFESEYLAFRNLNESNSIGWSIGSDLRFHLKNWIITSGINYSVYNQSRSYNHSYEEYSPENSYFEYDTTWVWIFDPPDYGTPRVAEVDSSWVEVYENVTIDNSGLNQLKYFEIPLMIGYRFNSNMFAIELNTGVSAGFLVYSKVEVPDFSNNNHIVDAGQMNSTMFNFIANASIYYYLNRRTSLFISPYYKQNLQSVFNENYPVKQQFKTIGVNFGVNILF